MDQRRRYLEIQVMNASPSDLIILLYDALIAQAEIAEDNLNKTDAPENRLHAAKAVTRCINMLTELTTSLKPEYNPELCQTLSELYRFFTQQFSQALQDSNPKRVQDILPLLNLLRSAWVEANRLSSYSNAEAA